MKIMKQWRRPGGWLILGAGLMWLGAARLEAQEAPDFGPGIEKFFQLGLPEVKNARYVKIKWSNGDEYQFNRHSMRMSMGNGPKLEGNGWLLEEREGQGATVLLDEIHRTEVLNPKVAEQKQKEQMEKWQKRMEKRGEAVFLDDEDMGLEMLQQRQPGGEWKDADLAKDLKAMNEWLSKDGDRNFSDPRMFNMQFNGGADYFLFAAHAYQKGMKAEANQLIALLFKRAGESRKVLSSAMGALADMQYEEAYKAFSKSGDWKKYLADMEAILPKFPGVWRDGPVVEKVAASVRKHLANAEPPLIKGEGLTEADTKLADDLARAKKPLDQNFQYFGSSWLFQADMMFGQGRGNTNATPIERLMKRKMQAVPLLIAMLKDEYLLRVRNQNGFSESFRSFDDDDGPMNAEELEMRLQQFARPVSRGEIATALLSGLVVSEEARFNPERKISPDELARLSREWYGKHKDQTEQQLLRSYLAEGNDSEKQMAVAQLMRSKDEADLKEVERYLLTPDKLAENIHQVTAYASVRGAKGKPFVTEYLAKLKALPSLVSAKFTQFDGGDRYRKQMEDQAKQQIKVLEDMVSDKTAESMLKEMLAAEKAPDARAMAAFNQSFWQKLGQEEPEQALKLILQGAADTKNDTLAYSLVQGAQRVQYLKMEQQVEFAAPPKPVQLSLEKTADLWKRLLGQTRQSPQQAYGYSAPTFRQTVAMMLDSLYGGQKQNIAMMGRGMDLQTLGELAYDVYVQRAEARLAGKPDAELPGFPDKSKVTDARKAELRQQLAALPPTDQYKFTTGLALNEILVLKDLIKEDPKLNEKLVPASHLVREVKVGITNDALQKVCEAFQGKPVDKKMIETLVEESKKLLKARQATIISVSRSRPLAGVQISVRPAPSRNEMYYAAGLAGPDEDDETSMPQGTLSATLYASQAGIHGSATWMVEVPKPEPPAGKKASTKTGEKTGDDDKLDVSPVGPPPWGRPAGFLQQQEEKLWEALGKLMEPTLNACEPYQCTLTGNIRQTSRR